MQLPGNDTVPYDNKVQVMTKFVYSSVEKNENIRRCEATENCKVRLFTWWGLTERNDCLIFRERKVEKGGEGEGKHTAKKQKTKQNTPSRKAHSCARQVATL